MSLDILAQSGIRLAHVLEQKTNVDYFFVATGLQLENGSEEAEASLLLFSELMKVFSDNDSPIVSLAMNMFCWGVMYERERLGGN